MNDCQEFTEKECEFIEELTHNLFKTANLRQKLNYENVWVIFHACTVFYMSLCEAVLSVPSTKTSQNSLKDDMLLLFKERLESCVNSSNNFESQP